MKMILYWLSSFVFFLGVTTADEMHELVFVQMLFRHGDRAPVALYPNDPNPPEVWPDGLGALTKLGKQQHYALGKLFRQRYNGFVSTNPKGAVVQSMDIDRCLMSAEANMAGFFAPDPSMEFEPGFHWQPVAIHTLEFGDGKISISPDNCPQIKAQGNIIFNSPAAKAVYAKHQKLLDNLAYNSGLNITNWGPALLLYDTSFVEKKHNLIVPSWIDDNWDEFTEMSEEMWPTSAIPSYLRLSAGPFLEAFIHNMQMKIDGKLPNQKIQVYSAHDIFVAAILQSLKIFNNKEPPYASTFIIELFKSPNGTNSVRLLYFNSSTPEQGFQMPNLLTLEGCSEFCPLDHFIQIAQPFIPDDWDKECYNDSNGNA